MHSRSSGTNSSEAVPSRWRQILLNRWLIAGVATIVLYALLGFLLTPWVLTRYVSNYALEKFKRKASIAEVHVNPFLFTFEGKDFVFQEADDRPIVGLGRIFVDFELSSIFRWAWTFADIRIERPTLHVEIQHNGRLNFADIADSLPRPKDPQPTDGSPPRMLIRHAAIVDGSCTFSDRSVPTPAAATFSPLNLAFNEISTLPEQKGPYTVRATLPGGGEVSWRGEISLYPIFSEGELSMAGFKLATAWKFAQDKLKLTEPKGEIAVSTHYRFDYSDSSPSLLLKDATFALKGLIIAEKGTNEPLLTLETIEVSDVRYDLQMRDLMVPNIVIRNGKVSASVDEKGLFDWQKLVIPQEPTDVSAPVPEATPPERQPWHLKAGSVSVVNVALDYTDRSRATPLTLVVDGLNIELNASAEVGSEPVKAIVDGLKVNLNRIALSQADNENPLISLDTLGLDDGFIDIGNRVLMITQVEAAGGETSVVRDKDGRIQLLQMLDPVDKGKLKREIADIGSKARAEGQPWSFSLGSLDLNDFRVFLQDLTFVPNIVYTLQDISASIKNLTNDKTTPISFNTSLKVVQGGSANLSGQVGQIGDYADAHVKLAGVNIQPLHPAVTQFTYLALDSGNVSVSGQVSYRASKSGPKLRADGAVKLNGLRLTEADTRERFLEWKEISANGIRFELSPNRLQVKELRLREPGAKVVIFKDRSVNLTKAIKHPDATNTGMKPPAPQIPTSAVEPQQNQTLFPVNINRVLVENGIVDFADFSLVLPFATQVTDFNGVIKGVSSEPTNRASLKFEGRVDQYGFSAVEGSLSPFAPKTFTDISVLFRNVEMKPLSPYSATFAGRKIASGKLNLNLEYKVQNSELLGENSVVLEQFTLGERVEAPDAISLPLDLAIALLTDAEGKIDVAVPVRGNLDHPEFKYGRVVSQAFLKLITKIVTAPFRALGSLFGDQGEQMDAIAFDPGSFRLLPPEQEKLIAVSEAPKKRPQLRLIVEGRFDPKIDGEALRTARTRHALAEEMGVKLAPEEELGPIAFDKIKTQRALEKLLETRNGDTAVDDFKAQYEKATGKKAKRTNLAMAVIGLASSDTAFYQAIFKELVKLEPLIDNDLKELALSRAQGIIKELKTTTGLDDTRVTVGIPGPAEKVSTKTVNTKLTLDVIKPAA